MTLTTDKPVIYEERPLVWEESSSVGAKLILALDRLFKVGPYYPPGHAACKRVTSDFQNVMKHFLQQDATLRFHLESESLFLQDIPVDPELTGAKEFTYLLYSMGIDRLEIDGHAPVDDLLTFVTRFLAFRNEIAGAKKFQQMEFDGLPDTIRAVQRHFATGIAIGSTAAHDQEDSGVAEEIADAENDAANKGDDAETASAEGDTDEGDGDGAGFVEGESEGDLAAVPEADDEAEFERSRNLDHAMNPNGDVTAAPPKLAENKRPVAENLDSLITRLEGSGQAAIRSRALESVELMIRNLGRSSRDSRHSDFLGTDDESATDRQARIIKKPSDSEQAKKPGRVDHEMSIADLRGALADYAGRELGSDYTPERDNTENFSIIMQMLADKQSAEVLRSIERKLERYLRKPLKPGERAVMVAGLQTLIDRSEPVVQFKSMPLVIRAFRKSRPESVIRFLVDACTNCSIEQKATLWPYLTNEVLLGSDTDDRALFHEICTRAGRLPAAEMRDRAPVLRKLKALKKHAFSVDVVQPPLRELYPVFSVLLEASHPGQIAVKLVRGLKYDPPAGVGEAVLPLIDTYRHGYREFLVELLAPGQEEGPSFALIEAASRILSTDLPSLNPKRRGEAWVPETIASLAELPVPGAEKILKTIKGRRFLFLVPTWPKPCRDAAGTALKRREVGAQAAAAAEDAVDGLLDEALDDALIDSLSGELDDEYPNYSPAEAPETEPEE